MKKMILVVSVLFFFLTLCGCGEQYPTVTVTPDVHATGITIDIGKPYVYKDFDIETIDGGKDLKLHFVESE